MRDCETSGSKPERHSLALSPPALFISRRPLSARPPARPRTSVRTYARRHPRPPTLSPCFASPQPRRARQVAREGKRRREVGRTLLPLSHTGWSKAFGRRRRDRGGSKTRLFAFESQEERSIYLARGFKENRANLGNLPGRRAFRNFQTSKDRIFIRRSNCVP